MHASWKGKVYSSLRNQLINCTGDSRSRRALNLRGLNLSRQSQLITSFLSPQATCIVSLDISYSSVDANVLSVFFGVLTHLVELSASKCLLEDAHLAGICLPPMLEAIDLSRNNLTRFPSALKELIYLRSINLSGNNLHDIDVKVLRLPFLHSLNLISNNISSSQRQLCHQGVAALRAYFQISPLDLPCDKEQVHASKPHLPPLTCESGYSSEASCSSLTSKDVLDFSQLPAHVWQDPDFCPPGYRASFSGDCCKVFLPNDSPCDDISVNIIQDRSLHPQLKPNEFLVSPVVCVKPHGCKFSANSPAMIALPHCTSAQTSLQVVPVCSNTSLAEPVHWKELDCSQCVVLSDHLILAVCHFSLFAAIAVRPYPSVSIRVSPDCGGVITMAELLGLELRFPPNCISHPLIFKTTLFYSDLEHWEPSIHAPALASACIAVEPHGTELLVPAEVLLPVPDATSILCAFPGAQLKLYHAAGPQQDKDKLIWHPIENASMSLESEVVRFSVSHFSFWKLLWNIPSLTLQKMKLGASYMYQSARSVWISVRCQVFMSPPLSKDLSFGMLVAFFKFGNPLRSPSNYRWLLADTGDKRVFVRTGSVSLELVGYFAPLSVLTEEELSRKMNLRFTGEDFCIRSEFALKLKNCQLPLDDYQLLGKLLLTQFDGTRFLEMNLIMVNIFLHRQVQDLPQYLQSLAISKKSQNASWL